MAASLTIALDAMGGDHGPKVVVPGAAHSLERHPDLAFIFFGDEAKIAPEIDRHPALKAKCTIVHTSVAVAMDAKPSQALRQGRRNSSMWLALDAVRKGEAVAAVSAGNTGALMAMAKFCVKTLGAVQRPAIAALWPTVAGETIVLDAGANVGATADELVRFALMGAAMARALFHVERPTVGILNIGVEEVKGVEEIRAAHAMLKAETGFPLEYKGFVEGDQIGHAAADVIVTDGFTGNIALKTAEGTAKQIGIYLRSAMGRSIFSRLGALLAQGAFRVLKAKMDPRRVNGAPFLGLQGLVIKSHGGTDAVGFASAIDIGYDMAKADLVKRLAADIARLPAHASAPLPAEPASATRE